MILLAAKLFSVILFPVSHEDLKINDPAAKLQLTIYTTPWLAAKTGLRNRSIVNPSKSLFYPGKPAIHSCASEVHV